MKQIEIDYAKRDPFSRARAKVLSDAIHALCALWCVEFDDLQPTDEERAEARTQIRRALEVLNGPS